MLKETLVNPYNVRTAAIAIVAFVAVGTTSASAQSARRSAMATKVVAERADSTRPLVAAAKVTPALPRLAAAMNTLPVHAGKFVRIPLQRPESITLVDVRNLFRYSDDQKWFEEAIALHERDITAMRSTLQGSLTLRDLLYGRQLSMQQVVAVEVSADGRMGTVYFRPD